MAGDGRDNRFGRRGQDHQSGKPRTGSGAKSTGGYEGNRNRTGNAGTTGYSTRSDGPRYDRPDDKPRYGKPDDRPQGDKPRYGKPVDRPQGDMPRYGKPVDRPQGDKPRYSRPDDRPQGDKPRYGKPVDRPQGDRPRYGRPVDRPFESRDTIDRREKGENARSENARPAYARPSAGPRPAAPARKPVPPAVRMDETPRPVMEEQRQYTDQQDSFPENLLVGRNPIREAIKSGRSIEKLLVAEGELSGSAREIVAKARDARIVVQVVSRNRLDAIYEKHQGMLAYVSAAEYSTVEDIIEHARSLEQDPFVIILDGITDPHNLGAVIRTAECVGAHGVIIPERRSAGLNPAAVKAAAGALEYIKVAKVVNISRTLDRLKEAGMWIVGGTLDGEDALKADLTGPVALVIGAEGEGISHLVEKQLDRRVSLPLQGKIDSLNASVAAGVLMYAILNSRRK